jgi:hypothetical protein
MVYGDGVDGISDVGRVCKECIVHSDVTMQKNKTKKEQQKEREDKNGGDGRQGGHNR